MPLDHTICESCRRDLSPLFRDDIDEHEHNQLKNARGWWCPVKRGHVWWDDSAPEDCLYALEQVVSTQTTEIKEREPRKFLGRKR